MADRNVSACEFWNMYFANQFVSLERSDTNFVGSYRDSASVASALRVDYHGTIISRDTLRNYEYHNDWRFTRIAEAPSTCGEGIQLVLDGKYPYREPPPYGKARMVELLSDAAKRWHWSDITAIREDTLVEKCNQLLSMTPDKSVQLLDVLIWFLGESRCQGVGVTLLSVIERSAHVHYSEPLPYDTIDTAFEALWKVNCKWNLPQCINIMQQCDLSGRLKFGALFKRLLSHRQLLSLEVIGENFYSAHYWADFVRPYLGYRNAEWDAHDAHSLFWEIRYLAASRLPSDHGALRELVDDEVSVVAELAAARLR